MLGKQNEDDVSFLQFNGFTCQNLLVYTQLLITELVDYHNPRIADSRIDPSRCGSAALLDNRGKKVGLPRIERIQCNPGGRGSFRQRKEGIQHDHTV